MGLERQSVLARSGGLQLIAEPMFHTHRVPASVSGFFIKKGSWVSGLGKPSSLGVGEGVLLVRAHGTGLDD